MHASPINSTRHNRGFRNTWKRQQSRRKPIRKSLACRDEEDRLSSHSGVGLPRRNRRLSAADTLLQSIDLAVAVEELGADDAYFRVLCPSAGLSLPSSCSGRCEDRPIEIGAAVIDMRYENPLYMAEDAGAADLCAGGRLQLGISRGSPEQVIDGWRYFGTCWPRPWS